MTNIIVSLIHPMQEKKKKNASKMQEEERDECNVSKEKSNGGEGRKQHK